MKSLRLAGAAVALAVSAAVVGAACGSPAPAAAPPAPGPTSATVLPAPSTASAALPTRTGSVERVPPGTEDATFTRALTRRNLTVTDDPNGAGAYGRLICDHVRADEPPAQLINEIMGSAGLSADDAGFVLGAATAVYCPEDLSKLPQR